MSSPSHAGLPPSSAPSATPNSSSLPVSRPIVDPLAFGNVRGLGGSLPNNAGAANGSEAGEDIAGQRRGGRRARLEDTENIPRVKDATGEKVMESFALFLEKWVSPIDMELMCQLHGADCISRYTRFIQHGWYATHSGRIEILHRANQGDEGV